MRRELTAAVAATFFCAAAYAQMPPNSFLMSPARTTSELIRQVKNNPVVMDRFVRHFQMSPDAVIRMLSGLHVESLKEDAYYEVFNVPGSTGEIRSRKLLLKKGTKVFANAEGTPVLQAACGNAMMRTDMASAAAPVTAMSSPIGPAGIQTGMPKGVETNSSLLVPTGTAVPDVTFEQPAPGGGVVSTNQGGAPFIGAGALGLLPALFLGLNGGGTSTVPEPSTIVALCIGAGLVAARLRRRVR